MTQSKDPAGMDADFGRVLEDFERDEDRRSGRKQNRGQIIRQKEPDEPGRPREYQHPAEEEDFAAALAAFEADRPTPAGRQEQQPSRKKPLQPGDLVRGTVLSIDLETSFVDIGGKAEAVISTEDLADSDGVLLYKAGDSIQAEVVGRDEGTGSLRLRPQGGGKGDPRGPLTPGDVVEGTVSELNKGGLDIDLKGRRAFCPISQISDRFVEDASEFVGRKLKFEVTRYEEGRGRHANIVVSRKALLNREKEARAAVTTLNSLWVQNSKVALQTSPITARLWISVDWMVWSTSARFPITGSVIPVRCSPKANRFR